MLHYRVQTVLSLVAAVNPGSGPWTCIRLENLDNDSQI